MNHSPTLQSIMNHNASFVENNEYEQFAASKYPRKKLAVVSCMDTRLTELLPQALGLKNGDAKIIKVAGAEVGDPFGSVMRSLLVAVYELGVEDIMIVTHTNCGAQHMSGEAMSAHMIKAGIPLENIEAVQNFGTDLNTWLAGFGDSEKSVKRSIDTIRRHPLMSDQVNISGFIIDTDTGKLTAVDY